MTNHKGKRVAVAMNKEGKMISNHYVYHPGGDIKVLRKKVDDQLIRRIVYYPGGQEKEVIDYQANCINFNYLNQGSDSNATDIAEKIYPIPAVREVLTDTTLHVFGGALAFDDGPNVPHGKWEMYYPNGIMKEMREYRYGMKTGKWVYQNDKGNKTRTVDYNIKTHIKTERTLYPELGIYKTEKLWYEDMAYGTWREWDFQGTVMARIEQLEVLKNPDQASIVDYSLNSSYVEPLVILDSITVTRNMPFPVGFRLKGYLVTLTHIDFTHQKDDDVITYELKLEGNYRSNPFVINLTGCVQHTKGKDGFCTAIKGYEIDNYMTGPVEGAPNGVMNMEHVQINGLSVYSTFDKWIDFDIVLVASKTTDHHFILEKD